MKNNDEQTNELREEITPTRDPIAKEIFDAIVDVPIPTLAIPRIKAFIQTREQEILWEHDKLVEAIGFEYRTEKHIELNVQHGAFVDYPDFTPEWDRLLQRAKARLEAEKGEDE